MCQYADLSINRSSYQSISLPADNQAGFCPHLGLQRQLFANKQVAADQKMFGCLLDLTAAADRVSMFLLWGVPKRLGMLAPCWLLLKPCTALPLLPSQDEAQGKGLSCCL